MVLNSGYFGDSFAEWYVLALAYIKYFYNNTDAISQSTDLWSERGPDQGGLWSGRQTFRG